MSTDLFYIYAEFIMRNDGDEGIKIGGRKI